MKTSSTCRSAFFNPRVLLALALGTSAVVLLGFGALSNASQPRSFELQKQQLLKQERNSPQGERAKTALHVAPAQAEISQPDLPQVDLLSENFDTVTPPTLPAGWTATCDVTPCWGSSNSGVPSPVADSLPNSAAIDDPAVVTDKKLVSPSFIVNSPQAQVTFRQNRNLESTFDGGVLEISMGGGAFADIITAGGSFVTGGYNATISTAFMSPISGRMAWSGSSAGFATSTATLPASAAGQMVRLQWRMASDSSLSSQGWRIDNVVVSEALLSAGATTIQSEGCSPANNVIDPGETVTVNFCVVSSTTASNLVGTLQATGGVTNPSGPQNYGAVTPGQTVCRTFTFTAGAALMCGGTITATINFVDGPTNLGSVVYTFGLGVGGGPAINEGFVDINTLVPAGWFRQNNSQPAGATAWFQGNTLVFPAQAGPGTSYIAANYQNTTGTNTISNWLLTPTVTLQNGAQLIFWTRTVTAPEFPDRLQIRMSTNGSSTNIGTTNTSVGDFTTLLLDINPTYSVTGYPDNWMQFTVPITGVPSPTMGRLAFRYFVENAGPSGLNSDFIGIDTVSYSSPATCCSGGAPQPQSAVSRKSHGLAGTFDVSLPLSGTPGIEPRAGGATNDYSMVVTFGSPVTVTGAPQAQVVAGAGIVGTGGVSNGGAVTISGNAVIIPLTNVTNAQTIQVRLNNVTSGASSGNITIPMGVLVGDTNANGAVNSADVSQTKGRLGAILDSTNFRSDVNVNGAINSADVSQIKTLLGTGLP